MQLSFYFSVFGAGNHELDYKALVKLSVDRTSKVVSLKEVQPLTGYIRGGVTVLGAITREKLCPSGPVALAVLVVIASLRSGIAGTEVKAHGGPKQARKRQKYDL